MATQHIALRSAFLPDTDHQATQIDSRFLILHAGTETLANLPEHDSKYEIDKTIFEELLRWYIEDFAVLDPFETTKAHDASHQLKSYALQLLQSLNLETVLPLQSTLCHLVIEIQDSGSNSSAFSRVHWEVLEKATSLFVDLGLSGISVIRLVEGSKSGKDLASYSHPVDQENHLHILAISARPRFNKDIPHRLVTRPIFNLVRQLNKTSDQLLTFTIARPGTFAALKEQLEDETKPYGYYRILHLDVHGSVDSNGSSLKFVKATPYGYDEDPISGSALAQLLVLHGVETVILNACQSAAEGESPEANFARTLVHCGIPTVIAMAYKVLDSAAVAFMRTLYTHLLYRKELPWQAVHAARKSLIQQPMRETKFGTNVKVDDYIVPLIYQRKIGNTSYCIASKIDTADPDDGTKARLESQVDSDSVIGRESIILELESDLLLHHKPVRIIGPAGVGKSALVEDACPWWKTTGFVDSYVITPITFETDLDGSKLVRELHQRIGSANTTPDLDGICSSVSKQRCLIVFENIESISILPLADMKSKQLLVKRILRRIVAAGSMVLIISRKREAWLDNLIGTTKCIGDLPAADALRLGMQLLGNGNKVVQRPDKGQLEATEQVIRLAHGNPLALKLLLQDFSMQGLDAEDYFVGLLRGDGINIDETWLKDTAGTRSISELQSLISPYANKERILQVDPHHMLPFWRVLPPVDDLKVYWSLLCNQNDHRRSTDLSPTSAGRNKDILGGITEDELKLISVSETRVGEDPEIEFISREMQSMLNRFQDALFIQGPLITTYKREEFSVGLESLHLHPLIPLVLRDQRSPKLRRIQEICQRAIPLFFRFRVKSWPMKSMYWKPEWQIPKSVLDHEFLNFLTAAYHTMYAECSLLNICFSYGFVMILPKGILGDRSRHGLLNQFWKLSLPIVMAQNGKLKSKMAIRRANPPQGTSWSSRLLNKVINTNWWTNPGDEILDALPSVFLDMMAMNFIGCIGDYEIHQNPGSAKGLLALAEKVYKERIQIPILDFRFGNIMKQQLKILRIPHGSDSKEIKNLIKVREDFYSLAAGLGSDVSGYQSSTSVLGYGAFGLGNSLTSPIEELMTARVLSSEHVLKGEFEQARTLLHKALLVEVQGTDLPYNRAYLYGMLGEVAEAESDWKLAIEHYTQAFNIQEAAGFDISTSGAGYAAKIHRLQQKIGT